MEPAFWHAKWARNETGFHKTEAHSLLVTHFKTLDLAPGARVLVPLCGMTLDIPWLLSQGFRVVGAELSAAAVETLFQSMNVTPIVTKTGALMRYHSEGVDIYAGDIFDLSTEEIGGVDAIYDRAALVALPEEMRTRYAAHLIGLSDAAPQILIAFDYDQSIQNGPPFSVPEEAVRRLYGARFDITSLASVPVEGGLKGQCEAMEEVWLLSASRPS